MRIARITSVVVAGVCIAACGPGVTSQVSPGKKIAFLVPDTTSSRYEQQDMPLFQAKLQSLCGDCTVLYRNANGDAAAQQQQADYVLRAGANVVVLDSVDASSASAVVASAAQHHVPVIAYDRLAQNVAPVKYFVGFDNAVIGTLQGIALLAGMRATQPSVVMLNGDATDRDASVLKTAVHRVIDGKVTIGREFDTPAASSDGAQLEMTQALAALQDKVDGVYAANDEMASGAVTALKAAKLKMMPPVTGGDAELSAVQRIVAGEQYMTVYRPVRQAAEAAAQLAYDVAYGVAVSPSVTGGNSVSNGGVDVPAVLIQPVAVTRKTLISTVVADGFWTRADICTGDYAQPCRAAGLS